MDAFLAAFALAAVTGLGLATVIAGVIGRLGFALPAGSGRLGCIDGLRGYLALSVMLHHFFIWSDITRFGGQWSTPSIAVLNELGAGGVALFFMITGAVFYPRIITGFRATSWTSVYIGRIFRILPLVAFSIAVVIGVILLRADDVVLDRRFIGAAARWLSAWGEPPLLGYPDSGRINAYVLWSLKLEWLFYLLLLPACAAAMDVVRARGLPTLVVPLGLLTLLVGARLGTGLAGVHLEILQYLPLFAVGMLGFECQARPHVGALLARPTVGILAGAALLAGMTLTAFPYTLALPLFGFFFVSVICGNDLGGLLRKRGALVLGECSFGIYLLHGIVLDIVFTDAAGLHARLPDAALPILLPAAMTVVVVVTAITYLIVERPAIDAGRAVVERLRARTGGQRRPQPAR